MPRSWMLWLTAAAVTVLGVAWQRRSGPSHDFQATVVAGGTRLALSLPRSSVTTSAARVAIPAWAEDASGILYWRRYPTDDAFVAIPLTRAGDQLEGQLPPQPPAGKLEYSLVLSPETERVRVPTKAGETIILRYHGPVPATVLVPHIIVMFLAMFLGVRAGLAAALDSGAYRKLTLVTLGVLTLGGLILGPITQNYAFGAYWTGVPFGWDLTDNKTLVMWIGWAAAGAAALRRLRFTRWLVVCATVVMLATYLVPHSVRGSQLDYTTMPATLEHHRP